MNHYYPLSSIGTLVGNHPNWQTVSHPTGGLLEPSTSSALSSPRHIHLALSIWWIGLAVPVSKVEQWTAEFYPVAQGNKKKIWQWGAEFQWNSLHYLAISNKLTVINRFFIQDGLPKLPIPPGFVCAISIPTSESFRKYQWFSAYSALWTTTGHY